MKKLFSITFAFIILLSGMHLSMATHFCGGEVASVKWSLTGKNASCGMEYAKNSCPLQNGFSSSCCQNEIFFLSVDKNYIPSLCNFKEISKIHFQTLLVPVKIYFNSNFTPKSFCSNDIYADIAMSSVVSLPKICVFII
jgi:hypothetical protein